MHYTYFFYVILIRFTFRFLHQCCHTLSTAEVHDVETTSPACFGKLVRDMSRTQGAGGGGALASSWSKTMKTAKIFSGHYSYLRRVAKQPVFRVTDHVHNKPDCTGKEVEGLYYL